MFLVKFEKVWYIIRGCLFLCVRPFVSNNYFRCIIDTLIQLIFTSGSFIIASMIEVTY